MCTKFKSQIKYIGNFKGSVDNNNTYLAQGGISTARGKDDINLFIEDTLRAGQYKNKLESVEILANESMDNI